MPSNAPHNALRHHVSGAVARGEAESIVAIEAPKYVATINVPGYLPMDDEPPVFDTAYDAWAYLAEERERGEDNGMCDETCEDGPACKWSDTADYTDTLQDLRYLGAGFTDIESVNLQAGLGTIYGDTPGYHGDHDLGLAYSVSVSEETGA